jgi:hypothetical protein
MTQCRRGVVVLVTLVGLPIATGIVPRLSAFGQSSAQQQTGAPPRDARVTSAGPGRIRGTVTDNTGQPLRRVTLTLTGRGGTTGRHVMTSDSAGRFTFKDLSAGAYGLTAGKAGYVTLAYGQSNAFEPALSLEVSRQPIDDVHLKLFKGGVVAGRVVDELGEPVAEALGAAARSEYVRGRRSFTIVSTTRDPIRTNDLGEFRLAGLAPGSYVISAMLGGSFTEADDDAASAYARTYFPDVLAAEDAEPVAVSSGGQATVHIMLLRTHLIRIGGTVVDSSGSPAARGMVRLAPAGESSLAPRTAPLRADGSFLFDMAAPPGSYAVTATIASSAAKPGEQLAEVGRTIVALGSEDALDIRVATNRGGVIAGRVTLEGGAPANAPVPRRVLAQSADRGEISFSASAVIQPDGTFEMRNVFGRSLLTIDVPSDRGWMVKEVFAGSRDITESGIEIPAGARVEDVRVLATPLVTQIAGVVVLTNAEPAPGSIVLMFAEDPARWKDPLGRYVRFAKADHLGRYAITGLPPARYKIAALPSLDTGAATDPAFLQTLRHDVQTITLADGERTTVSPRLRAR